VFPILKGGLRSFPELEMRSFENLNIKKKKIKERKKER
jgi:hypothetical protein